MPEDKAPLGVEILAPRARGGKRPRIQETFAQLFEPRIERKGPPAQPFQSLPPGAPEGKPGPGTPKSQSNP